ncbi:thioredoxin family protein [Spongiivirga citrea]|uniref:Thioredoxin family protein n=1 Tax=Spongiivirga citrea TaxID=1481457 RepID=A0A6M0CMC8_9FLAO|nr:thioredoxin family protein [Spongiivirga citrea]NER16979.1 thioredoxin family protein [Spongiivirga citrea]
METIIQTPLAEALENAISYQEYRTLVADLVAEGKSTGPEQTDALLNYSTLNDRRMKRLDKTMKLSEETVSVVEDFKGDVTWLVLTESWCGDAAQTMPAMQKLAGLTDKIDFKVVLRDENLELMDQYLTNGGRSIPKLIAIDNATDEVVGTWGPRPTKATKLVNDFKEAHGKLTPEFKQDLQVWYNKDKGQDTITDLLELLK